MKATAAGLAHVDVPVDRVEQHFGVPPNSGRQAEWQALLTGARHWFHEHVTPWVRRRQLKIASIAGDTVSLEVGGELHSHLLAEQLSTSEAHKLCAVALCAGRVVDQQIQRHWRAGRPDEAFALHAYGSALIEELRHREAQRLGGEARTRGERVLPYLSPGYAGWPLEDQTSLFALIADQDDPLSAGPIELLESGGLRPSKSTLAAFGVTLQRNGDSGFGATGR